MRRKKFNKNKAVGYIRPSDWLPVGSGESLHYQHRKIEKYCESNGLELVVVVSGQEEAGPVGYQVQRLATEHDAGSVVALWLDSVFVNTTDMRRIMDKWDKSGIILHLITSSNESVSSSNKGSQFAISGALFNFIVFTYLTVLEMRNSFIEDQEDPNGT